MKKGKNRKSQEQKREEKRNYRILVGFAIYGVLYYFLFRPNTIGHDIRYSIFINWLPLFIGLLVWGYIKGKYIRNILKSCEGIVDKVLTRMFLVLMGLILSYLSFGITTDIIWNYLNKKQANKSNIEVHYLPVERFDKGSSRNTSASVAFIFQGRLDRVKASRRKILGYWNDSPENYEIEMRIKKGFWNKYLIESWNIVEKNKGE